MTTQQPSNEISDFTNSAKGLKKQGQGQGHANFPCTVGRLDFDFDSVLGAANTTLDLIGPLSDLVNFLDGATAIHPYIAAAVGPFKVLVNLELNRRTNNKKIGALYNRMGSMMASLKPLLETDQEPDSGRLQPLLEKVGNDISECGNMLDVYKKQSSIIRFIKSESWKGKLMEFAEKFIQHERDIGLCLSISTHLTTARIEKALNQISVILGQESTTEAEFHRFVKVQGGLTTCVENDTLFTELVKKSGVAIIPESPVLNRPQPMHTYDDQAGYAPRIKTVPVRGDFQYTPRRRGSDDRSSPERVRRYTRVRSPSPQIRHPRGRRHRQPTFEPYDYAPDKPLPVSSGRVNMVPPPAELSPARNYPSWRPPSPVLPPGLYYDRRRSPLGDRQPREYYPRSPRRSPSPELPEYPNTNNIITQLKIQVTSALETSLDIMIQQNTTIWMIKFTHQMQLIQSFIESSKIQILKAIERSQSGHHERLHDPHMQNIWESEKWRSSVFCSTFLEGVHDYFWHLFQDAVAEGDSSQPIWTLQFLEKPYWSALCEVLDVDQSGLISVSEVNYFSDGKPEDLSLAVYLAVTALKCGYETTFYKKSLKQLLDEIDERSLVLSTDSRIQTTSAYAKNLDVIRSSLLDGIVNPPQHISNALINHQLINYLEIRRRAHESYWEECLKKVHWEIDGAEILNAFANDRPIEQYLLPLLSVLLRRVLLLIKMFAVFLLDPRELPSSGESIYQVLNTVNARVTYLQGCFAERNDRLAKFIKFACGLFSEWDVYISDPIQPSLEESSLENSSEEISSDDLDSLRDQLQYPAIGPIPVTRPLPIAKVTTVGELVPRSRMPILVKAVSNYNGADDKDLTFRLGDIIEVSKTSNDGWWTGRLVKDKQPEEWRLFPANLVVAGSGVLYVMDR